MRAACLQRRRRGNSDDDWLYADGEGDENMRASGHR